VASANSSLHPIDIIYFDFLYSWAKVGLAFMLDGKTIVIIGGTTGLGLSAAKACATAGARLVIAGRNPDSAAQAQAVLPRDVEVVLGDAATPELSVRAIQIAREKFGNFWGLYHVAGGSGRKFGDGPLHELTDEGIESTLSINLKSVLYSNRAAVQAFLEQKSPGVVLNMGSVLGNYPSPHFFATHTYAAAKAAIAGLTRSAAAHYAPQNIRFNVIAPALVETPMARRAANDPEILKFIKSKQPLDGGRIGQPEDLDEAVVYLLSPASKFVTGQVLHVDGGWSVTEGQIPS
jgi:NAD(P)-dependent dehydrogenase (short-subunit alcohol dehydrogenase family)